MKRKLLLEGDLLNITLSRLCCQLMETHNDFSDTVLIGLQPRGIFLADAMLQQLAQLQAQKIPIGYLDITFHRDDFGRRPNLPQASTTKIPCNIENKKVVLIDDVLYTGRSTRAALDSLTAFGRPKSVELLVLIERSYARDLPIEANYIGKSVNTLSSQKIEVKWIAQGHEINSVWIIE